jgi:hypothetical protein
MKSFVELVLVACRAADEFHHDITEAELTALADSKCRKWLSYICAAKDAGKFKMM